MNVKIKRLSEKARVPRYSSSGSAGFDFYALRGVDIKSGKTVSVPTGIAMEIPEGYHLQIWDRSGLGSRGIHRFAGVVDSDYRGEIKVVLYNSTLVNCLISRGDRIAQGLVLPIDRAEFEEVEELGKTKRGGKGFGSSGK